MKGLALVTAFPDEKGENMKTLVEEWKDELLAWLRTNAN